MLNEQLEGSSLEKLSSSQGCLKLASTIKAYVATVSRDQGRMGELLVVPVPQFLHLPHQSSGRGE